MLTKEEIVLALPDKLSRGVSQDVIDNIHEVFDDPDMFEHYRNNFLHYGSVLQEGRYSMDEYLNAIKYCSHKFAGLSNKDAYVKTFPDRYKAHVAKGTKEKDIASYITAYNKTQLVTKITQQAMIPVYLLNQDVFQQAINVQVELMTTAESEKVRSDAANSLLNHLKPAEAHKIELNVGIKQDDSIHQLRNAVQNLAEQQREAIKAGKVSALNIAESRIIDAEVIE